MLNAVKDVFKTYHGLVRESFRQINQQRLMVDPDKMVLNYEFENCFAVRGARTALYKGSQFLIREQAYKAFWFVGAFEEMMVPVTVLPAEVQKTFRTYQETLPKRIKDLEYEYIDEQESESPRSIAYLAEMSRLNEEYETSHVSVVHLDGLMKSWDRAGLTGHFFTSMARKSVLLGQPGVIIDFWKAVNDLKDYSTLFPDDHAPPGGKNRSKKSERESRPVVMDVPVLAGARF